MKLSILQGLSILSIIFFPACRQEAATPVVVSTGEATELSTLATARAIHYRGDTGRTGVIHETGMRTLYGLKSLRSFHEDAYFPVYTNETLYGTG